MIQLRDVSVHLHNSTLWNNLNLKFENETNYLIRGRNGSGKTTLLKLLSGNLRPKSGTLHYSFIPDDGNWDERYQLRKQFVHFIPTHALHDVLRSHEFYYQQRYYTIEGEMQTVRNYLGDRVDRLHTIQLPDSFNINHLLDLEMTRLSNGQIKKVIILSQLLDSIPKVLLLDYPFEGLDGDSRIELSEFLDHLSVGHGVQLIVADHDDPQLLKSVSKVFDLDHVPSCIHDRTSTRSHPVISISDNPERVQSFTEPVVEMQDLTIRYGDKVIIDKLNWTIRKGERWALTGRNGSGKTTLFSLIFADHPMAYSEKVFLFGKRRGSGESIWDIKRRISYLGPEQLHFLDNMTENLKAREYLKSASAIELKKLIDLFGVEDIVERKLNQLSDGELQLILLMSLFVSKKEILMLDEPFQFLDHERKELVTNYLQSSLDPDTTLVLITHYEEDVARWTNHRMKLDSQVAR
jgi:molybdate transport system ATP-binding protein